jgi:SAM-dependent methyltransferase
MASLLKTALDRVGLLAPTFTLYERLLMLRGLRGRLAARDPVELDGLPVPPARLRVLVSGHPDLNWFIHSGQVAADAIREALGTAGVSMADLETMLDFGCGCGRVARHWRDFPGTLYGTDSHPDLVRWCRDHLPFGRFSENGSEPPLPWADGALDFVYAVSVFTHLTEDAQQAWMAELARVVRSGGYLLVTAHGEAYLPDLLPAERLLFESGRVVVRNAKASGRNLCAAYHPPRAVQELARGLHEVVFLPARIIKQDLHLFLKPPEVDLDAASGSQSTLVRA